MSVMDMLINLKSLAKYLNQSSRHEKEELVVELRDKLHQKEKRAGHKPSPFELVETSNRLGSLIVSDPGAPASLLHRMSGSNDPHLLERIAEHPNVAEYTLSKLAESVHKEVRMSVAENIRTPYSVLHKLAQDEHPDVRFRLAEMPHICRSILAILEQDENPYVSDRASRTLEKIIGGMKEHSCAA